MNTAFIFCIRSRNYTFLECVCLTVKSSTGRGVLNSKFNSSLHDLDSVFHK